MPPGYRTLRHSPLLLVGAALAVAFAEPGRAGSRGAAHRRAALPPSLEAEAVPKTPRNLSHLGKGARRALGISTQWKGAPPLPLVTRRVEQRRRLEPLEREIHREGLQVPEIAAAHLAYGNALAAEGHDDAAAAEYLEAVALEPTLTAAWNNLGSLVRRAWNLRLAREIFEAVTQMEPTDGLSHFNLALIADMQGNERRADAEYLRALELDARLWMPAFNPLVVGNARATSALHHLYLKRETGGGLTLDRRATAAPVLTVEQPGVRP